MAWAHNSYHYFHYDPLAARFALGPDRALHCSTWLLDLFNVLLFVLCVIGVRFFLVQDLMEVVQLDPVFAYTHNNLHCNHTHKCKDQITSTCINKMKLKEKKNSTVISNCTIVNINTKLLPGNGAKKLDSAKA